MIAYSSTPILPKQQRNIQLSSTANNNNASITMTPSPSILRRAADNNNNGGGSTVNNNRKRLSVTIDESLSYQLDLTDLLAQFDAGNPSAYNELCTELSTGMLSARMLCETLTEISDHVANLCYTRHQALIRACMACNWHQLSEQHTDKYFSLVVLLATTQPHCVSDAIKVLIHTLMYVDGDSSSSFDGHLSDRELHCHRLSIEAILAILRVIPMASESLITTLIARMPYVKRPARQQAACIGSMLKLSQQFPDSSHRLLQAVCQRLIQVDLLCSRDQLCGYTITSSDLHHQQSSSALIFDSGKSSGGDADAECLFYAQLMDALMYTVFRFLYTLCYPKSTLLDEFRSAEQTRKQDTSTVHPGVASDSSHSKLAETDSELCFEAAKNFYTKVLKVFGQLLLSTSATSHAQFALFWLISQRRAFTEHTIEWLWLRVAGSANASYRPPATGSANTSYRPPATGSANTSCRPPATGFPATVPQRCTAALYIGSLLARAKFASIELVRATLEVMCGWLHRYLDRVVCADSESTPSIGSSFDVFGTDAVPQFAAHRVFYAVCQAVFYVIAFRHGDMTPISQYLPFLRSLNLERLVTSHLNPLNNCMPSVVRHFSRVTRHYQLVYCNTIIARNRREQLPVVFQTNLGLRRARDEGVQLTFFPFDPYVLQHSGWFVEDIYREYCGESLQSDGDGDCDDVDDATAAATDDEQDDDDVMSGIDVPVNITSAMNNTAIELAAFSMSPDVM